MKTLADAVALYQLSRERREDWVSRSPTLLRLECDENQIDAEYDLALEEATVELLSWLDVEQSETFRTLADADSPGEKAAFKRWLRELAPHDTPDPLVDAILAAVEPEGVEACILIAMRKIGADAPENRLPQDEILQAALSPEAHSNDYRRRFRALLDLRAIKKGSNGRGYFLSEAGMLAADRLQPHNGRA